MSGSARRVFDDGCYLTERTLVTIGDNAMLNAGSKVQCHSQEDGTFKSDRTTIGADCTLGVGAFVHYGVTMGDGAVLAADSFLMKGEEVPPHARWGGNPAGGRCAARPRVPTTAVPPWSAPRHRFPGGRSAARAAAIGPMSQALPEPLPPPPRWRRTGQPDGLDRRGSTSRAGTARPRVCRATPSAAPHWSAPSNRQ